MREGANPDRAKVLIVQRGFESRLGHHNESAFKLRLEGAFVFIEAGGTDGDGGDAVPQPVPLAVVSTGTKGEQMAKKQPQKRDTGVVLSTADAGVMARVLSTRTNKRRAKQVVRSLIASFVEQGLIDPSLPENDQLKLAADHVNTHQLMLEVDHRVDVIDDARSYRKLGRNDMACLMYAVWFEHTINRIIVRACRHAGHDRAIAANLIKLGNFETKFSWVLRILKCPEFNREHHISIMNIAEMRNVFVHYKWTEIDAEKREKKSSSRLDLALQRAEAAVTYARRYERRVVAQSPKPSVKKARSGRTARTA